MPRLLFDQTLVTAPANRARGGTVLCSLVIHAAVLAGLVALQFTTTIENPAVARTLEAVVVPRELPVPPPAIVRPRTPAAVTASPVPLTSPDRIEPAPVEEIHDVPSMPPVIGGVPCAGVIGVPLECLSGLPGGVASVGRLPAPPPAPPAPQPPSIVRIGGNIKAPERLAYRAPVYPPLAVSARVEGTVLLEATIDERGAVRDVTVVRSIPMLDRAAIEAVSQWRYTPTRLNGTAVPVVMNVTVSFRLR